MDLGAVSPFFYAFRERELILQYLEKLTGQRMMYNYFVFGGVRHDIFDLEEVENISKIIKSKIKDYEDLITENPIFLSRTVDKGVLEPDIALNNGITGVNLRASGVSLDFRKFDKLYNNIDFNVIISDKKDSWARYKARVLEIQESLKIVNQALTKIKTLKFEQTLIKPLNLKLPEGEYYSEIESPRGLASLYINSDGKDKPYRLKWRTPSYYSVNLLRKLLVGTYLNDAIAISGSLDIILPEVDK